MVAGYGNGAYGPDNAEGWTAAGWARFPDAMHVLIDVLAADPLGCGVLDVETGDATPADAPAWIKARVAAGHVATVYCSLVNLPAVQDACHGLDYAIWAADYTGLPHEIAGTVGTQYENNAAADVDLSAIYDATWHASA